MLLHSMLLVFFIYIYFFFIVFCPPCSSWGRFISFCFHVQLGFSSVECECEMCAPAFTLYSVPTRLCFAIANHTVVSIQYMPPAWIVAHVCQVCQQRCCRFSFAAITTSSAAPLRHITHAHTHTANAVLWSSKRRQRQWRQEFICVVYEGKCMYVCLCVFSVFLLLLI